MIFPKFPKRRKNKNSAEIGKIDTVIGASAELNGNIFLKGGTIRIDGHLQGNISGADGIIVGKRGVVEGDVTAGIVLVGGRVIGNITASQNLEVLSSAEVRGDLKYCHVSIEQGAVFEGKCQRTDENKTMRTKNNRAESLIEK